ncbi:MAG: cysteine desulfurase [Alicyclobacillaceae bacterium]|nr:cysteine desulfurase [Alicyclobacillaceae bacterium]
MEEQNGGSPPDIAGAGAVGARVQAANTGGHTHGRAPTGQLDSFIYLDHAATSPLHPEVLAAMQPYLTHAHGNASSLHRFGREARRAVEQAREQLAAWMGCDPSELVFTSGGTEADHSALCGLWLAAGRRGHIVTTMVEHHAVLHTCDFLERLGAQVTRVAPGKDGVVRAKDVLAAIRPDTVVVSVMWVNNELGSVEPVLDIAAAVRANHPHVRVHTDAVQGLAALRLNLHEAGVDAAAFSAHKVGGPKGVGALYIRRGTPWWPVLHGGSQERGRRAGTENVAGIVGFGAAIERLRRDWDRHEAHLLRVRDRFWAEISRIPGVRRNSPADAVPGILNVAFAGVRNDRLLMRLDLMGVAASAGSACTAGSLEPSHVLSACGQTPDEVREAVRFSFSDATAEDEVVEAAARVRAAVTTLRERTGA